MNLPAWLRRVPAPNVLAVAVVVLIAANYFGTFADLDFAWQIRTGERIVETGQLRPPDALSYTMNGTPVRDFEWLHNVSLYGIWSSFGFGGLKFLRVLLVATPLVLLGLRLKHEGVRWYGIAMALVTMIAIVAPAWNLRPLYYTSIGLFVLAWLLHDHCVGRRPLPTWLPAFMLLWANLHPGVITGQGLLVGAMAWEWLNRGVRLNRPLELAACQRLSLIGALGLAATFLSPDPIERLLYPFRSEVSHPIQRIFAEMQPLHVFATVPPYTTNLAYVLAGLVLITFVGRFRAYRLWEVALLAGLALLANVAYRSLQDWVLHMLALSVPHLGVMLRDAVQQRAQLRSSMACRFAFRFDRLAEHAWQGSMLRLQIFWPVATLSLLAVVSVIPAVSRDMPMQEAEVWPRGALDWAEANGATGRFFGPADYGTYVTWRLGSRATSYVDTRGYFFPPVYLEDSQYLPQLTHDWRPRLARVLDRGTDYFLLETTGPRGRLWLYLQPHVQPLYEGKLNVLLSANQVRQGIRAADMADRVATAP